MTLKHEPTAAPNGDPTTCWCCGRHAVSLGVGNAAKDPRYLCVECIPLLEYIKDVRRWSPYEVKALDAVDEATGDYAAAVGKTDIASFSEEERRGLWRCAISAHQDGIRRLIKDGEAPW